MISLVFISIAAAMNACMDKLQFHFSRSIFVNFNKLYWNPGKSWRNKYIGGDPANGFRWYGLAEYFVSPFSGWHLCKSIMLVSFCIAIVTYSPIVNICVDFVTFRVIYGAVFELFFKYILESR